MQSFRKRNKFLDKKKSMKIRPFILTCDKNIEFFSKFVNSYIGKARLSLQHPIVYAGYTSSDKGLRRRYNSLIAALSPEVVIPQPRYCENDYANIQYLAIKDIHSIGYHYVEDALLFFEDDIVFSSKFANILSDLSFPANTGLLTLYSNGDEYFPNSESFIYEIDPKRYYGNQAVLFPKKVVADLSLNWQQLLPYPYGWDLRWAGYLSDSGYKLYATYNSYVQHIGHGSRLHTDQSTRYISNRYLA